MIKEYRRHWFAWYPVRMWKGYHRQWVWLRWVVRTGFHLHNKQHWEIES
jgi:hypothetical protein